MTFFHLYKTSYGSIVDKALREHMEERADRRRASEVTVLCVVLCVCVCVCEGVWGCECVRVCECVSVRVERMHCHECRGAGQFAKKEKK